jgi:hypothetical protein
VFEARISWRRRSKRDILDPPDTDVLLQSQVPSLRIQVLTWVTLDGGAREDSSTIFVSESDKVLEMIDFAIIADGHVDKSFL